jgi:hypothetical protein
MGSIWGDDVEKETEFRNRGSGALVLHQGDDDIPKLVTVWALYSLSKPH